MAGLPVLSVDLGPGVRAAFTRRSGGVSTGPWQGLNLGAHVGDDPGPVRRNRALLAGWAGAPVHFGRQVHGTTGASGSSSPGPPSGGSASPQQPGPPPASSRPVTDVRDGAVVHYVRGSGLPITFRYYIRAESAGRVMALPAIAEVLRRPDERGHSDALRIEVQAQP